MHGTSFQHGLSVRAPKSLAARGGLARTFGGGACRIYRDHFSGGSTFSERLSQIHSTKEPRRCFPPLS